MLTFGMKIFIDLRDTYICGWLDLRLPVFAYLENCLGCTEVSRLPFPESLCMKCSHGKSWNERWKLAIYALTWFFLVQMGNSGQRYWIIDSPFKRLWVCVPQIFLLPVIKKSNQNKPQHFNFIIIFACRASGFFFPRLWHHSRSNLTQ